MSSGLLNLVDQTVRECDHSYHELIASSAQEVDKASLELVKKTLVNCQREVRRLFSEARPAEQEPLEDFLNAVRSADRSRRVLAGLVGNRALYTRRRSAAAAAKDFDAMEDRFDEFMTALNVVSERGRALKLAMGRPQARVQRRGEIKMVIDDEAS
ncbi:hypothetical protein [Streptomyces tauricus]|uniref:hypothetical protein n=1 Tax=Streptomyces tauricus TaxID=68274 RepID=UPI003823E96F